MLGPRWQPHGWLFIPGDTASFRMPGSELCLYRPRLPSPALLTSSHRLGQSQEPASCPSLPLRLDITNNIYLNKQININKNQQMLFSRRTNPRKFEKFEMLIFTGVSGWGWVAWFIYCRCLVFLRNPCKFRGGRYFGVPRPHLLPPPNTQPNTRTRICQYLTRRSIDTNNNNNNNNNNSNNNNNNFRKIGLICRKI